MTARVLLVLLLLANLMTAIAVVDARHRHRERFAELNALEKARDALDIEFGRLQIEQATVGESNRIELIASTRLGMRTPEPAEIVVVQP
jgi:cell division protein FtsL